jgi:hypothetical protein
VGRSTGWAWALLLVSLTGACGAPPDRTPPALAAPGFVDGAVVNAPSLTLVVRANDDRGVDRVTYLTDRGVGQACPASGGDDYACGPIPLAVGDNALLVRAVDGAGLVASLVLHVVRADPTDVEPPSLSLHGVADGDVVTADHVVLTAVATDAGGVAGVSWATDHGDADACDPEAGDAWTCGPIPLPLGPTLVTVTAWDLAGNARSVAARVTREPPDTTPPTLVVSGVDDGATVTSASITLVATATDDRGVASVRYATDHGAAGVCGPATGDAYPCGPIPLPIGDTQVTVTASDAAGLTATDVRRVRREAAEPGTGFDVEFVFFDHVFVPSQLAAFEGAAARWEALLVGDLEAVAADLPANASCGQGEPAFAGTIDDVVVFVTSFTDGVGGVLGYAGPCLLRGGGADAGLPAVGFMAFDALDVSDLAASGALVPTIVHELGHVLGFGTIWELPPRFDLLDYVPAGAAADCRTATSFVVPPTYTGAAGVAAWRALGGAGDVPVEDDGGPGTRCGHWDEATFGPELMTGYLDPGAANPLSALSARSFEDLGYAVDATAADPYALPGIGGSALPGGIDLAAREVLLAPRGVLDPATGEVGR